MGGGGMEVLSWTLCISSLRTIFGGLVSPVGCLDKVSGALFFTPGTWTILKRKVFSFRFLSLVLVMLSRDLSPNILRSGLWSTVIVRFLHPIGRSVLPCPGHLQLLVPLLQLEHTWIQQHE